MDRIPCISGRGRAATATQRVHGWRIVELPLDIEASCEISGNLPTNKQLRTNSGLSTRVQEVGGWHHHPYETLQMPYDGEVTWRVQATNQRAWPPAKWVASGEDWSYG